MMERIRIPLWLLAACLVLSLTSCEQMFSANIFAKLTHKTPSTSEIAAMSPAELQSFVESPVNLAMLKDDEALKAAALANCASVYAPASAADPVTKQTAAIVAADIAIQTVPAAAGFANNLLATAATSFIYIENVANATTDAEKQSALADLVSAIVPDSVETALASGAATPPADFVAMVEAFQAADVAYEALNQSLLDNGSANYASLPADQTSTIAVNAVLSTFVGAIEPTAGSGLSVADALWAGMMEARAGNDVTTFTPDPSFDFNAYTGDPIIKDSGLSSLFATGGTK